VAAPSRLVNVREPHDTHWRAAAELDGHVVDVASLRGADESVTVDSLVEQGPAAVREALDVAVEAVELGTAQPIATATVEIGSPILRPSKILCVGFNYRAHADEAAVDLPTHPNLFAKFTNSLAGPYEPVRLPTVSREIDYEGELAVVIGRTCKDVPLERARAVIAGFTVFNDISARDLQFRTSQFTSGKALDTFAPMGPGLVPTDQVADPGALRIATYLNGERLQDASTGLMVFGVEELVARISELMTLYPGDVIATGTPAGVGYTRTPPVFLKAGDLIEVEIEGIGRISNPVVDGGTTPKPRKPDNAGKEQHGN
jgi:2-keto-4-pentenoate hydratase/2-oxohepta-3-ene-1,7-dioic acid hydratase in catechol pathway